MQTAARPADTLETFGAALIDAISDMFCEFGSDGRVIRSNLRWRAFFAWTQAGTGCEHLGALVHPEDLPRLLARAAGEADAAFADSLPVRLRICDQHYIASKWTCTPGSHSRYCAAIVSVAESSGGPGGRCDAGRFRDMVEFAHDGVWEIDADGRTLYVNRRMAAMLETTVEVLQGRRFLDFIAAEHRRQAEEEFIRHAGYYEGTFPTHFRTEGGRDVWAQVSAAPRLDKAGRLISAIAHVTDITDLKMKERMLADRQARLSGLLAAIQDQIFVCNEDGVVVDVRASDQGVLRGAVVDTIGRHYSDVLPPEAASAFEGAVEDVLSSGEPREFCYWTDDSAGRRHFRATLSRLAGTPRRGRGCLCVVSDVTDQRRAAEALSHSEVKLRALFDLAPVGFALNRLSDGMFIEQNPAFLAMTGYSAEEFGGMSIASLTPREYDGIDRESLGTLMETGQVGPFEKEYVRKDGSRLPVAISAVRFFGPDREQYAWSVIRDVSEQKAFQERVLSESMRRAEAEMMLREVVETIPDGIAAFDAEERLILFNKAYREIYKRSAKAIRIGAKFEDILRYGLEAGQFAEAGDNPASREEWLRTRLHLHRDPRSVKLQRLDDGRWLQIRERRSSNGITVGVRTDITGLKEAEAIIKRQASEDALTGLSNRTKLMEALRSLLESRRRAEGTSALVLLDLDYFKEINDTCGHDGGDALLRTIAGRLRDSLRKSDEVARLGGDEFALLLRNLVSPDDIAIILDHVLAAIRQPVDLGIREVTPSVSIGVALLSKGGSSVDQVYKQADIALYHAKASGRNTWAVYDSALRDRIERRREIASALRRAIGAQEITVALQPQVLMDTGDHVGFEALARWQFGDSFIAPSEFVTIAEETDQIGALGDLVLRQSLRMMADLREAGLEPGRLAVNVATGQLRNPGFVARVQSLLAAFSHPPGAFELEVTENVLLDRSSQAIVDTLRQLNDLGMAIALDDFGTGYASLSHLTTCPVNSLKIDRSFVSAIGTGSDAAKIPATIIGLARNLNMSVIAEGIETQAQYDALNRAGCTVAQGYLISPPLMERHDVESYLRARAAMTRASEVFLL